MCVWEGAADCYREFMYHGGILSSFFENWYDMQIKTVQYGLGENGPRHRVTGDLVCGDVTLSDEELAANRCKFGDEIRNHPMDDEYHQSRSPIFDKINVPLLSSANWGGQGLHPRGNFEGYERVASDQRYLEVHGIEHWTEFYTDYGVKIQKDFFARFLKGDDARWPDDPKVRLLVRHVDKFVPRTEDDWPIPRTQWTTYHLNPADTALSAEPVAAAQTLAFEAMGDGVTFSTAPVDADTEITGPIAARLQVSSSTEDADLFLVLQVLDPDDNEIVFQGAIDPHTPIAQGWLRASHRKLDPNLSKPHQPYHTHNDRQMLTPGEPVELDIEIWATSIVVPKGCRIALQVKGCDYVYQGKTGGKLSNFKNELTGCGPFLHNDPVNRPPAVFAGTTTLHLGDGRENWVMLPIIPKE